MDSGNRTRRSGEIYAEILRIGLLAIRGTSEIDYANALADHLHNLPALLRNLEHAGLHDYYWRVERPDFVSRVGAAKSAVFATLWMELEAARKLENEPK